MKNDAPIVGLTLRENVFPTCRSTREVLPTPEGGREGGEGGREGGEGREGGREGGRGEGREGGREGG